MEQPNALILEMQNREVEEIEASLISLGEAVAPTLSAMVWTYL